MAASMGCIQWLETIMLAATHLVPLKRLYTGIRRAALLYCREKHKQAIAQTFERHGFRQPE